MKINDEVILNITDFGMMAEGIAKQDGKVFFVPMAIKGQQVSAKIKRIKDNLIFCKLKEVLKQADLLQKPPCNYYGECGGCQLQHIKYDETLKIKAEQLKTTLQKIGNIDFAVDAVVKSDIIFGYRNKNVFPIAQQSGAKAGMFKGQTNEVLQIENCLLASKATNEIFKLTQKFLNTCKVAGYNFNKKVGELKFLMVQHLQKQTLVTLVATKQNDIFLKEYTQFLIDNGLNNFGVYLNVNNFKSNLILSPNFKHIFGLKSIDACFCGIKYQIVPASFMQVNTYIQTEIYNKVLQHVANDVVVDGYCGAGLLSALIAKKTKQVVGIEVVPQAINSANALATNNDIKNLKFICGDCGIELPKLLKTISTNCTVVLDPPAQGCDERVLESLISSTATQLIYLSCNPKTLARDLKVLTQNYKILSITPYDMFPQTMHCEVLAILSKK